VIHERQKLEEGAGPAVEEGNGDGIWFRGEDCGEVDTEHCAIVVFDVGLEVREGVDVIFLLSPVIASLDDIHIQDLVTYQSKLSCQCFFVSVIHFLLTPNCPSSCLFS
jgi:hypothetical protein